MSSGWLSAIKRQTRKHAEEDGWPTAILVLVVVLPWIPVLYLFARDVRDMKELDRSSRELF